MVSTAINKPRIRSGGHVFPGALQVQKELLALVLHRTHLASSFFSTCPVTFTFSFTRLLLASPIGPFAACPFIVSILSLIFKDKAASDSCQHLGPLKCFTCLGRRQLCLRGLYGFESRLFTSSRAGNQTLGPLEDALKLLLFRGRQRHHVLPQAKDLQISWASTRSAAAFRSAACDLHS